MLARGAAGVPIPEVCSYDPFMGAATQPTRQQFESAIALRERAVAAVQRPELAAARSACLGAVGQLRATGGKPRQP